MILSIMSVWTLSDPLFAQGMPDSVPSSFVSVGISSFDSVGAEEATAAVLSAEYNLSASGFTLLAGRQGVYASGFFGLSPSSAIAGAGTSVKWYISALDEDWRAYLVPGTAHILAHRLPNGESGVGYTLGYGIGLYAASVGIIPDSRVFVELNAFVASGGVHTPKGFVIKAGLHF